MANFHPDQCLTVQKYLFCKESPRTHIAYLSSFRYLERTKSLKYLLGYSEKSKRLSFLLEACHCMCCVVEDTGGFGRPIFLELPWKFASYVSPFSVYFHKGSSKAYFIVPALRPDRGLYLSAPRASGSTAMNPSYKTMASSSQQPLSYAFHSAWVLLNMSELTTVSQTITEKVFFVCFRLTISSLKCSFQEISPHLYSAQTCTYKSRQSAPQAPRAEHKFSGTKQNEHECSRTTEIKASLN